MPQTVKGERFQWFKCSLDMWGTIAPPDKSRFPAAYRDEVYLDIGAPGRCVRRLYVESILDCEGNEYDLGGSGVGEHELVSDAHTDVDGSPTAGDILRYDGSQWTPQPLGGAGASFIHAVPSGNQSLPATSGRVQFNTTVIASGVTNVDGAFQLPAGIYALNATISADFTTPSGYVTYQWYDITNSGLIGAPTYVQPELNEEVRTSFAAAVLAPVSGTLVELRIVESSGLSEVSISGSQAWLYTIGGRDGAVGPQGPQGPPGDGGGGGGTPNLTFSGLLDTENVLWTSGQGVVHDGSQFVRINLSEVYSLSGNYGDVFSTREIEAGAGLTGGGDLSIDRILNVGAGTGIQVNANDVALDLDYLDARYQPSGLDDIRDGEHHLKYLGAGLTKRVRAREQILTAFDYFIDEDASLFLEEDGEQVVITDDTADVTFSGLQDVVNVGNWVSGVMTRFDGVLWQPYVQGTIPVILNDLTDVNAATPTSGQRLTYDGSNWVATDVAASGNYVSKSGDTMTGDLIVQGTVQQTEGLIAAYRAVSATTTLATSDQYVVASGTAEIVLDLPTAPEGQVLTIKRTGLFNVHVSGAGALIDGLDVQTIEFQWSAMKVISDGTDWYIV